VWHICVAACDRRPAHPSAALIHDPPLFFCHPDRARLAPQGHLKFEGRTLKGTDTPASALDAEDAWQDAQESGEDATVQVDFVVP